MLAPVGYLPQIPMFRRWTERIVARMKGLILSGGSGKRLRPLTHTRAKQLVPIANKPILFYGIEQMAAAGINEVGIIIAPTTGEEVIEAVGDGSDFGVRVTPILQQEPLGLAHCVYLARDFLGEDDFVMYLGDNMLESGLVGFVERFAAAKRHHAVDTSAEPVAQILLAPVENPTAFGVAEIDADGRVCRLVEKPDKPPSNLALVGVYMFDRTIHEAVQQIKPSPRGELEITDAICWLITQGYRVDHCEIDGWWIDTGKKDPLLECNRLVLDTFKKRLSGYIDDVSMVSGQVVLNEGAKIIDSEVRGPAVIGDGTTIRNSKVGPYVSIADGCSVSNCEIDNSVVLRGGSISDLARLTDSLVGRDAELSVVGKYRQDSQKQPAMAVRLMVGDHCRVEIES